MTDRADRAGSGEGDREGSREDPGSTRGHLLVAAPTLFDPNFVRTVVLMLEHNRDGALGVVLNRPTDRALGVVEGSWAGQLAPPEVVFGGGPVDRTAVLAVAVAADGDGFRVVDLDDDPDGDFVPGTLRVFSGYAGWGPDQLDGELEEGAWIVVEAEVGDVSTPDPDGLWSAVLRRQQGWIGLLAAYPPAPWLN